MQKHPLLQVVTNLYLLIFSNYIFIRGRSSGSSSRKIKKMYGKRAYMQVSSKISPALHFTVTTVTNYISTCYYLLSIIKLLIVTVKNKTQKRRLTVTNCHSLLQTVTSLSHPTVTRYNYYNNHTTIYYQQQFVTVKHRSW